jgi:hypothetical protein
MRATIDRFATVLLVFFATGLLHAEVTKPVEGILSLSGKPYKLLHAAAYETKVFGKAGVTVVASSGPINVESIKKALAEKNGDGDVSLRLPHVKVVFESSGKIHSYYAYAAGFTTSASGDGLSGEMKLEGGRVTGKAKLASEGEGDLQRSFDFQFATGLIGSSAEPAQQAAPLAKLGVSGTFKGNGKEARLAFVSARPGEPFADKPSIVLIFTERDHSREQRPDIKAGFGDFGSALIISCHEDGAIFGCEVAHASHGKKPFSSSGKIEMTEFQIAGGQVQGQLSTGGEATAFDQTWEVNLKFAAPFAGLPKTPDSKAVAKSSSVANKKVEPTKRKRSQPDSAEANPAADSKSAARLNVKDLAILQGVSNLEYKKLVEQVAFESPSNYKTLAAELAKKLDAQGWKKDGNDLIGVSAILKRKLGGASLTIFVKPAAEGSKVSIMSEGLSWDP